LTKIAIHRQDAKDAKVVSANPVGNSPRYLLVIAEIDEARGWVKRQSMTIIDKREEGEPESLQLSNFGLYEDRETGEIVLTMARLFPKDPKDWTAPCMMVRIEVA